MIQQFTYTASPWGKSGAGWQVFQQSRNVTADVAKKLHEVYRYEGVKKPTDGDAHPIQFAYLPSHLGAGAVLAQSAFTGMRWWGEPRPGDFFAHVLLLDEDAVEKSCKVGFNPVRLFMSPKLQSDFPSDNGLKEKALRIFRKETAWEAPPELPELLSLSDLPENPHLAFDTALDAIPEHAARQLGALVRAIVRRTTGNSDKPIVFDSGNKFSPFVMALALDLIPPAWRARTWFAVHFTESALRRLPVFSSLTFYGTDGTVSSDPDSGIASGVDFADDPFNFIDRDDVRTFKRQLDLIGEKVSADDPKRFINDYKGLIDCRSISFGKSRDLASLRSAMLFADNFPGLKDEIGAGLARSLATYTHSVAINIPSDLHVLSAVAWFECGLKAFEDHAKRACSVCIQDLALLEKVTQELKEDVACSAFVNAVVDTAMKTNPAAFANRIVESKASFERFVSRRGENDLFRLAVEYKKVLSDVQGQYVIESHPIDAGLALKKVNALIFVAGSGVKGVVEVKKYLEYRQEIATIRRMDTILPTLKKYVSAGFPQGANPRKDILDHIPATSVREIVDLAKNLDALNLQGKELIYEKWERDQKEIDRLRSKVHTLENLEPGETKSSGCLLPVIVCLMGIALGFFIGKKFGSSKVEKISHNEYLPRRVFVEPADNQDNGELGRDDKKKDKPIQTTTNETANVELKAVGNQDKGEQVKDDKKKDKPVQTATNNPENVEVKADAHDAKVN